MRTTGLPRQGNRDKAATCAHTFSRPHWIVCSIVAGNDFKVQ